jgi:hypothetical protein
MLRPSFTALLPASLAANGSGLGGGKRDLFAWRRQLAMYLQLVMSLPAPCEAEPHTVTLLGQGSHMSSAVQ